MGGRCQCKAGFAFADKCGKREGESLAHVTAITLFGVGESLILCK